MDHVPKQGVTPGFMTDLGGPQMGSQTNLIVEMVHGARIVRSQPHIRSGAVSTSMRRTQRADTKRAKV